MSIDKKKYFAFVVIWACFLVVGCSSGDKSIKDTDHNKNAADTVTKLDLPADTLQELRQLKVFLLKFKAAIAQNDPAIVSKMIFFPMQTQPIWSDEDLKERQIGVKDGLIDQKDFLGYYGKELFDLEQRRILKYELQEDDLHAINLKEDEFSNYYHILSQETDSGIPLFTYYLQWAKPDGRGDYWFGLVIGKVKGEFKVLSYYSLWPVKG